MERAREVDADDAVPGLGRHVEEIALRIVDPGAFDQDVDAADALDRLRHRLLVGDIERDRFALTDRSDLLFRRGQRLMISS